MGINHSRSVINKDEEFGKNAENLGIWVANNRALLQGVQGLRNYSHVRLLYLLFTPNPDPSPTGLPFYEHGLDDKANDAALLLLHFVASSTTLNEVYAECTRGNEVVIRKFIQAIAANPKIESLHLEGCGSFEIIGMLLLQTTSLKTLYLAGDFGSFVTFDLQESFRQNRTLQSLCLEGWNLYRSPFHIFADAIRKSPSITSIEFRGCVFNLSATKDLLELVCESHSKIRELKINCRYGCLSAEQYPPDFFMKIIYSKAPTAKLRKLIVNDGFINLPSLLQPFQEYTCSSVPLLHSMGLELTSDSSFDYLVSNLPTVRGMEEIVVNTHSYGLKFNNIDLVGAMRRNHCLKILKISDANHGKILTNLGKRNQMIQGWRDEPHEMPKKHLYRVLSTCLQYEARDEIIFDLLKKQWSLVGNPTAPCRTRTR